MSAEPSRDALPCPRCGGPTVYLPQAIVPGNPMAPRGSRRGVAHAQPAWACVSCGHLQPEERRAARNAQQRGA